MQPDVPGIDKILVVIGPDRSESPLESRLIERAVSLATTVGCALELFQVSYDGATDAAIFASFDDLARARQELADADATRLAELAAWLTNKGIAVTFEARWDSPRTDAILRKIDESRPDVVLKAASEHAYVLGITSHTDWELARRSPADVWLVNEAADEIRHIVAALGNTLGDATDVASASDSDVLKTAAGLSAKFEAELDLVNAYQLPTATTVMPSIEPAGSPAIPPVVREELREQVVERHRRIFRELADRFDIDAERLHVEEGDADTVIEKTARAVDADLVVMGANSLNRLERFLRPVTVEPVMASVGCDLLIVREEDDAAVPKARGKILPGEPGYDLAQALANPARTFDSPDTVVELDTISVALKRRILQIWEYDLRAALAEENEGGPVGDIDVEALRGIEKAKAALGSD